MKNTTEVRLDRELYELNYNIRETMQAVQLQFDVIKEAIDKCGRIARNTDHIACIGAVNAAHSEILRFMELNIKLAKQVDDLRNVVCFKK
jgi:hypothetical protein